MNQFNTYKTLPLLTIPFHQLAEHNQCVHFMVFTEVVKTLFFLSVVHWFAFFVAFSYIYSKTFGVLCLSSNSAFRWISPAIFLLHCQQWYSICVASDQWIFWFFWVFKPEFQHQFMKFLMCFSSSHVVVYWFMRHFFFVYFLR